MCVLCLKCGGARYFFINALDLPLSVDAIICDYSFDALLALQHERQRTLFIRKEPALFSLFALLWLLHPSAAVVHQPIAACRRVQVCRLLMEHGAQPRYVAVSIMYLVTSA